MKARNWYFRVGKRNPLNDYAALDTAVLGEKFNIISTFIFCC